MSSEKKMLTGGQAHELLGWANRLTVEEYQERRGLLTRITDPGFSIDQIKIIHVIDCDTDPFVPKGWNVESHKKGGHLKFDLGKIRIHLDEDQQGGKKIGGNALLAKLENEPVLNANVLDYFLEHVELIPEEWKGRFIFFWGTIYRRADGRLCVRYLYWCGYGWHWSYSWLDGAWGVDYPAALLAS